MTLRGLHKVEQLLGQAAAAGLVLGLDTAASPMLLGLVNKQAVLGTATGKANQSHAASLPLMVEALLRRAGVELSELRGVAVGVGPGSFTGVRIALSYGKGLAFAAGCPIVGVSTFESMAACALDHPEVRNGAEVRVIIDARRNEFYSAAFRVNEDGLEQTSPSELLDVAGLSASITEGLALVSGDAASIEERLRTLASGREAIFILPTPERCAAALSAIGAARIAAGRTDSVASLEPLYVRPAQARLPQPITR